MGPWPEIYIYIYIYIYIVPLCNPSVYVMGGLERVSMYPDKKCVNMMSPANLTTTARTAPKLRAHSLAALPGMFFVLSPDILDPSMHQRLFKVHVKNVYKAGNVPEYTVRVINAVVTWKKSRP